MNTLTTRRDAQSSVVEGKKPGKSTAKGVSSNPIKLLLAALMLLPVSAQADMFSAYVMGKSGYAHGTGAAFARFDQSFGSGAEAGVEIIGVDLWGEALDMGSSQYMFTANIGYDHTFGKKWRLTVGAYTGPMMFMFPREESDPLELSGTLRTALTASGMNPTEIEARYNQQVRGQEEEINQYSLGWNLVRARVQMERKLVQLVYVGLSAQAGYHYLLNGEQIAAEAKDRVIEDLDQQFGLSEVSPMIPEQMRSELGAEKLETDKLGGLNYNLGAYLKFEI